MLNSYNKRFLSTNFPASGFTLIELIVVIAVVGVLATVITSYLGAARNRGNDSRRVSDVKQIQSALELYYSNHQSYPVTLNLLIADGDIASIPTPPKGLTGEITYKYSALGAGSDCNSYHLGVTLDDINNLILNTDSDVIPATVCDGSVADFSGADPVYDVKP